MFRGKSEEEIPPRRVKDLFTRVDDLLVLLVKVEKRQLEVLERLAAVRPVAAPPRVRPEVPREAVTRIVPMAPELEAVLQEVPPPFIEPMDAVKFIRFNITETAANTFTQKEIPTPIRKGEVLLFHVIEALFDDPDTPSSSNAENQTAAQLTASSQGAIRRYSDADTVWLQAAIARTSTEITGVGSRALTVRLKPDVAFRFEPPIVYAVPKIFVAIKGIGNSVVKEVHGRIHYTTRSVRPEDFEKIARVFA